MMAAGDPAAGGDCRQIPKAESKTELSLTCSLWIHSRNICNYCRNLHFGYLTRHNAVSGQIWTAQAGSCSNLPLAGKFFLLIGLLTSLSTRAQSLEHSIKGSTKLGQVKIPWKVRVTTSSSVSQILYPTYYLAVWPFPCSLGHQGPSWTTANISPQHYLACPREIMLPQPHRKFHLT